MNFEFFKTNLKTYTIPFFIVIVDQVCKSFIFSKLFIEMKIVQINVQYTGYFKFRLLVFFLISIFFVALLGQVGFEPTANRLKAEYSTTELLTRCLLYSHHKVFLQIAQIWI